MLVHPIDRVFIVHATFLLSGMASLLVLSTLCRLAAGDRRGGAAR